VRGEMEAAVQEGGQEAQWREIGLGVVAQEFRIAEDEAFFEVMVRVPCGQRKRATGEPCGLAPQPDASYSRSAAAFNQADDGQGERDDDGRFLA